MPNKKDNQKTGSKDPMSGSSGREFEDQQKTAGSGKGQQAGSFRRETASNRKSDDDEMNTAGGREGQFSDKKRDTEGQWSPGSGHPSDR